MKRRVGIALMLFGALLLTAALALAAYNASEENEAEKASSEYLERLIAAIPESPAIPNGSDAPLDVETDTSDDREGSLSEPEYADNMAVIELDGYEFVGYISIPKLGIQLPVMSETEGKLLKLSPCRFSGSPMAGNLVIGAHNYSRHFGSIDELSQGDSVIFADMEGGLWRYRVVFVEILDPNSVEYLTDGEYPLTLYTCVYGGKQRVTVRCEAEG
ncbi:MAG: sortase [Clostridia bacterium]|nr:sortase [Clostridia bacterium]